MSEANPFVVSQAAPVERADFYRRTYLTVSGALAAFGLLLYGLCRVITPEDTFRFIASLGILGVIGTVLCFWLGTALAQGMALGESNSRAVKWAGFGLYVLLEALIFLPLMAVVAWKTHGNSAEILLPACTVTGALIVGLTVAAFVTQADFSFLQVVLVVGLFAVFGIVLVAALFGTGLGMWFSLLMIGLMATAILYQTWLVRERFATDQHLEAGFVLFSSFVTLLFYVIRLFLDRRD